MNDYTRAIASTPRAGAYLNGDIAIYRSLEIKQELSEPWQDDPDDQDNHSTWHDGYDVNVSNITEDMSVDLEKTSSPAKAIPSHVIELLTSPLPPDLLTMDKDLLILMAAYNGDIDRYARLRRPMFIKQEADCCVRGIFHNTMFAIYWARKEERIKKAGKSVPSHIAKAISARFIINNVLHRMMSESGAKAAPKRSFDD
ncbi:hypothetical protein D6D01_05008 [Aureobasidium pullulans]|uniref:Uncharacterized protein n=1 Tax=Aureobasidium pullulans TaxID=5580 RepID=A0A4S9LAH8_AURPU|nr:hypothetical protein D6D01_05008 [Aureobasidium pullulans]